MNKLSDYTDPIDMDEHIARIDKLLAETHTKQRKYYEKRCEYLKKQREGHMQPWQVAATVFAGDVVCFAAGAAFAKLIGG